MPEFLNFKLLLPYHFNYAIIQLHYEAVLIILMGNRLVGANNCLWWIKVGARDPCTYIRENGACYILPSVHGSSVPDALTVCTSRTHRVQTSHRQEKQCRSQKKRTNKKTRGLKASQSYKFSKTDIRSQ